MIDSRNMGDLKAACFIVAKQPTRNRRVKRELVVSKEADDGTNAARLDVEEPAVKQLDRHRYTGFTQIARTTSSRQGACNYPVNHVSIFLAQFRRTLRFRRGGLRGDELTEHVRARRRLGALVRWLLDAADQC
jgi:hypothetical protein